MIMIRALMKLLGFSAPFHSQGDVSSRPDRAPAHFIQCINFFIDTRAERRIIKIKKERKDYEI